MSFRFKTILGVALIEILFLLILVFNSLDFLQSSNEREIEQRAHNTLRIFASTVKDAVIASDIASLEELVTEIIKQPEVNYVQILNLDLVLAERREDAAVIPESADVSLTSVDDGSFDVRIDIEEAGIKFGSVRLGFHTGRLEALISDARDRLLLIAGIEVILVAIFSYYFGLYLTRRLERLRDATRRIAGGAYGIQVDAQGKDEVAQVIEAFNQMSTELACTYQKLQSAFIELNSARELTDDHLQRTQAILDTALDGIMTINEEGIIQDINPAGAQLFQYHPEELKGKNVKALMIAEFREPKDRNVESCLLAGIKHMIGQSLVTKAIKKDGTDFPIDLSVSQTEFKGQKTFVGLVRDLSEREAHKREMAAQMALHQAITESSLDALVTIDGQGMIKEFSPAAVKLFGYDREFAIGRGLTETIIPKAAAKDHAEGMRRYHETGHGPIIGERIQVEAQHREGHLIPVEMVVTPIEVDGAAMFTAFIHDISERKAYEESLERAKLEAEAGSEAKSRFLATMSHEIRSPLNAILGSLDLLEETALSGKQGLYTKTAFDAGRALLGLINDVLDFSKIEAGQLELDIVEFSPENLINEVLHICQAKAQPKDVDIGCYFSKVIPDIVKGDQTRLRQIMINLLDNAIKFSDHGVVALEVTCGELVNGLIQLQFSVIDQGIGIPEDKLDDLFSEFTQVDASHSTRYGGTGLGLAICARLIKMMNGEITVTSRLGEGTEFQVKVELSVSERTCRKTVLPDRNIKVLICHPCEYYGELVAKQYQEYGVDAGYCCSMDVECDSDRSRHAFDLIIIDELVYSSLPQQHLQTINEQWLNEQGQLLRLVSTATNNDVQGLIATETGLLGDVGLLTKPLTRSMLLEILLIECCDVVRDTASSVTKRFSDMDSLPILLAEDSQANQVVACAMLQGAGYTVDVANNGQEAIDAIGQKNMAWC